MPVISPNFQSSKTKKKIKDIPGYIEIKIEKKNDKGNLLDSEIDYIALKKEQNKVESREHDKKNATKDKAESEKYIETNSKPKFKLKKSSRKNNKDNKRVEYFCKVFSKILEYIEKECGLKFGLNFRKQFIRVYGLSIDRMKYILDLKISQLIDLCYKNMKQEEGKMKNVEEKKKQAKQIFETLSGFTSIKDFKDYNASKKIFKEEKYLTFLFIMSRTYKELFIYYLLSEENFSEFFSKEICYDLKSMKISIKESKEKTKKIEQIKETIFDKLFKDVESRPGKNKDAYSGTKKPLKSKNNLGEENFKGFDLFRSDIKKYDDQPITKSENSISEPIILKKEKDNIKIENIPESVIGNGEREILFGKIYKKPIYDIPNCYISKLCIKINSQNVMKDHNFSTQKLGKESDLFYENDFSSPNYKNNNFSNDALDDFDNLFSFKSSTELFSDYKLFLED
jgi:heme-degrading monooxygenase HmoA